MRKCAHNNGYQGGCTGTTPKPPPSTACKGPKACPILVTCHGPTIRYVLWTGDGALHFAYGGAHRGARGRTATAAAAESVYRALRVSGDRQAPACAWGMRAEGVGPCGAGHMGPPAEDSPADGRHSLD